MMKKHSGFSLVELMIVVAIIGVISAIAYPSYNSYMQKSRRADAKVGMTKIADRQERFFLQNDTYTTSFAASGLNMSNISEEGYYEFAISSADLLSGYTITATPVAGEAQTRDVDCQEMTLSSTGAKGATAGSGGDSSKCW